MVNTVSATGELSAVVTVEVGTEVSGQIKRGTIWRLDARGKPESFGVVLGASDSTHTEISGPQVKEGMDVIAGIIQ